MTPPLILTGGRAPLLLILTFGLLSAHAMNVNEVLMQTSSVDQSASSHGDDMMVSSSSMLSSSDELHDSHTHDSADESSSVSGHSSSLLSSSVDPSDTDDVVAASDVDAEDPLYVSSDWASSSSSVSLWTSQSSAPIADTGNSRRMPASLQLRQRPEGIDPTPVRRGRPPAVFRPWLSGKGVEGGHGGHQETGKFNPEASGDGPVESDRPYWGKDATKPEQGHGTGHPSKGRQWGGEPSPHHQKVLRQADTTYLDLYLCGQFLPGTPNAMTDDFAVAAFNYAGRAQPFSPCSVLGSTEETNNFVYRTRSQDSTAFHQMVAGLPSTWLRYGSQMGVAPRVVHLFTYTMPSTVDEIQDLLMVRSALAFRNARFVLGFVRQPTVPENQALSARSAEEFVDLLDALREGGIDIVRVCGRCARVAGTTGRRRAAMRYGMSAVQAEVASASQCRPLQEHDIPGAEFVSDQCGSFQKSVLDCAQRSLQRRCPTVEGRPDPGEESLRRPLDALIRTCVVDADCWNREGISLRPLIVPEVEPRCSLSRDESFGRMIARCASGSIGRPFDV